MHRLCKQQWRILHVFNERKWYTWIDNLFWDTNRTTSWLINFARTQNLKDQLRTDHLNAEEQKLITNLYHEIENIFYLESDYLTFTNELTHCVDTNRTKPIFTKSFCFLHVHKEEVRAQINKMLQKRTIRPFISPWFFNILEVSKEFDSSVTQKCKVVINCRKLNKCIVDDTYPLHKISDLLDQQINVNILQSLIRYQVSTKLE